MRLTGSKPPFNSFHMDLSVAFSNKNYQSIVDYYSSLTSSGDATPHEKHIVAISFYYLGDFNSALSLCESIYPFLNGDEAFLAFYGSALRKSGDTDGAHKFYKDSLSSIPGSLLLKNNLANLLIDLSMFGEAKVLLEEVLSQDSQYTDALENIKRLEFLSTQSSSQPAGNPTNVSTITLDPLDRAFSVEEVHRTFKTSAHNQTDDVGVKDFQNILPSLDAKDIDHERIRLARSYLASDPLHTLDECKSLFESLGPHSSIYCLAGDAYVRLKLFADAETSFYSALLLGSQDPSIFTNLANLVHMRGDQLLAYSFLELCSKKTPDFKHLQSVRDTLFPQGKPALSTSPFQYNPDQIAQNGHF